MEIKAELNEVFRSIFKNPNLKIQEQYTAEDINGWDSLTHMHLISTIESHFSIVFSFDEVSTLENIGDIIRLIHKKKSI